MICVLLILAALASAFALTLSVIKWPLSAIAVILVVSVREWRSRRLSAGSDDQLKAILWGFAAGIAGFVVSQLLSPSVNVQLLVLGALGIGGAIGIFTSLFATSLILVVSVLGSVVPMLRRGR